MTFHQSLSPTQSLSRVPSPSLWPPLTKMPPILHHSIPFSLIRLPPSPDPPLPSPLQPPPLHPPHHHPIISLPPAHNPSLSLISSLLFFLPSLIPSLYHVRPSLLSFLFPSLPPLHNSSLSLISSVRFSFFLFPSLHLLFLPHYPPSFPFLLLPPFHNLFSSFDLSFPLRFFSLSLSHFLPSLWLSYLSLSLSPSPVLPLSPPRSHPLFLTRLFCSFPFFTLVQPDVGV